MKLLSILAMGMSLAALSTGAGAAEGGLKVGLLSCSLTERTDVLIYSSEEFRCTFNPNSGSNEMYTGSIKRIGVDLVWQKDQELVWAVLAPSTDIGPGALAGGYVGGSADASFGVGAGAKVLIGGFENSIALQPLSLAGNSGVGASAGIEALELEQM